MSSGDGQYKVYCQCWQNSLDQSDCQKPTLLHFLKWFKHNIYSVILHFHSIFTKIPLISYILVHSIPFFITMIHSEQTKDAWCVSWQVEVMLIFIKLAYKIIIKIFCIIWKRFYHIMKFKMIPGLTKMLTSTDINYRTQMAILNRLDMSFKQQKWEMKFRCWTPIQLDDYCERIQVKHYQFHYRINFLNFYLMNTNYL